MILYRVVYTNRHISYLFAGLIATAVTLSPRGRRKRKDNLCVYLYEYGPIYLTQTRFSDKMLITR